MSNSALYVHLPTRLKIRVRIAAARGETTVAAFVRTALESALQAVESVRHETP